MAIGLFGSKNSGIGLTFPRKKKEEEDELERLNKIAQEKGLQPPSLKEKGISALTRGLDLLSRVNYATAEATNVGAEGLKTGRMGTEAVFEVGKGFWAGLTGKKKTTFGEVLEKQGAGEGFRLFGGKITGRGVAGFAGDVLLDPTTYLTLGTGTAAKVTLKSGAKVALNKAGRQVLSSEIKKGVASGLTGKAARELAEQSTANIVEKAGGKYLERGGLKFAGKTVLPEAQEFAGELFAKTKIPQAVKKVGTEILGPVIPDAKLKVAGFGEVGEQIRNLKSKVSYFKRRTVDQVTDIFTEKGKLPNQSQMDQIFDLADKGLPPQDIARQITIPETPRLKVGEVLPKTFSDVVDQTVTDPTVNRIYKTYLTEVRPELTELATSLGLPEEKLLKDYIFRGVKEKAKKGALGVGRPFKEKVPSQLKRRVAEEFTGEVKDPLWAVSQSLAELRIAVANNGFIDDTLKKYGIKAKVGALIPEGFKEFKPKGALGFFPIQTEKGKVLAGVTKRVPTYYVPEEIADALTKFTSPKSQEFFISKLYDAPLRLWKGAVTSLFPAYHIRNMIGNVYNNWLGGVNNPRAYEQALAVQFKRGPKIMGFTPKEIMIMAEDLRVVRTGFYGADIETMLKTANKGIIKKAVGVADLPIKTGTFLEDNAKVAHFIDKIRKGFSPDEAARSVRKYLFDYSELSDFEKGVMRRVIPFYTWTRKNIPLQIESFIKTPGKPAALADVIRNLPKGEQEEIDVLPDWVKEGIFVKLGPGEKGTRFAYSVSTLPIEDINRLYRGTLARTAEREIVGATAPLPKFAAEELAQKNFFYNEDYDKYAYSAGKMAIEANFPKPVMNWLEYRKETFTLEKGKDKGKVIERHYVNPTKFSIIMSTPLTRFITTAAADNPEIQATMPFKVRDYDIEVGKSIKQKEREKEMEEFLIRKGVLKEFTKTFVPKGEEETKKRYVPKFSF